MSTYKTEADRLAAGGIQAKRDSGTKVWIGSVSFAPKGHNMWHPRATDDPGDDLVQSIVDRGFDDAEPLILWEETIGDGEKALYVIDGSRRTNASLKAEEIMKGSLKDGKLFVPCIIYKGEADKAIGQRLRANSNPLQRPDSCSVLCTTFEQLAKFGWDAEQMAAEHGRLKTADVEALLRFMTLPSKTRAAFDKGVLPMSEVATFLDNIAPEKHEAAIEAAEAAGGAAKPRKAKKAAKKAAGVKNKTEVLKPVSGRVREVVTEALRKLGTEGKNAQVREMAKFAAALLSHLGGDTSALDEYETEKVEIEAACSTVRQGRPSKYTPEEKAAMAEAKAKKQSEGGGKRGRPKMTDEQKAAKKAEKKAAKPAKEKKAKKEKASKALPASGEGGKKRGRPKKTA